MSAPKHLYLRAAALWEMERREGDTRYTLTEGPEWEGLMFRLMTHLAATDVELGEQILTYFESGR